MKHKSAPYNNRIATNKHAHASYHHSTPLNEGVCMCGNGVCKGSWKVKHTASPRSTTCFAFLGTAPFFCLLLPALGGIGRSAPSQQKNFQWVLSHHKFNGQNRLINEIETIARGITTNQTRFQAIASCEKFRRIFLRYPWTLVRYIVVSRLL